MATIGPRISPSRARTLSGTGGNSIPQDAARSATNPASPPEQDRLHNRCPNRQPILLREQHGSRPTDVKCAEGRPIEFLIHARGVLPTDGVARLVG